MKRLLRGSALTALSLLFSTGIALADNNPLEVRRITPGGENVPIGRQIVLQFNRAVVPVGRMDRTKDEVPITITPELKCQWRWLNTSALACQLGDKDKFKAATQYTLELVPGIKAEDGATTPKPFTHKFTTQRPRVSYTNFHTWRGPGTPVLRVSFNQAVSKSSVTKHVFFSMKDNKDSRRDILVEPDPNGRKLPRYLKVPGEPYFVDLGQNPKQKPDESKIYKNGEEARRVWLVSPVNPLPQDAPITFEEEPGLESALGPIAGNTRRTVLKFHTFPDFKFEGIVCQNNHNRQITLKKDNHQDEKNKCNPLSSVGLAFSAPVLKSIVRDHMALTPDLAGGRKDYDPWANLYEYSRLRSSHRKGRLYKVYLPELLKAHQQYQLKISGDEFKDEFGRALPSPVDFTFFTDHRKPNYNLVHKTAVLEKNIDTEVPLFVTNLDEVNLKYKKLTTKGQDKDLTAQRNIPEEMDVAFKYPMNIRELLDGGSGAVYGHLSSKPHVQKGNQERTLFAQVTPFQVHVKAGHFNTLVWVTDFKTGEPVANARVTIYEDKLAELSNNQQPMAEAKTDATGAALLPGTKQLDPNLKRFQWGWYDDNKSRLFVRVEYENDLALVPLDDSRFAIDTYRVSDYSVYSAQQKEYGHIHTWGTTAQGIYRAGDTIQYKIYVRDQDNNGFTNPPESGYKLEIVDPKGQTVHTVKDITLSEFGGFSGEFTISKNAAVGWFQFKLQLKKHIWQPMRVLVSDFTPSPFKVEASLNADLVRPETPLEAATEARLHSGGPYTKASVRVSAHLKPQAFRSKHKVARKFYFGNADPVPRHKFLVFQENKKLDDSGNLKSTFNVKGDKVPYGKLTVESAVRDDRGKFVASMSGATFIGVERFVGMKPRRWLFTEGKEANVDFLVTNERGQPVGDTHVTITIERKVTKASRVKGAGNAYLTQFVHQWVNEGTCQGKPDREPEACTFTPSAPGSYRLTAEVKDSKQRTYRARMNTWVAGKGRVVWQENNTNALKMVAESEGYKVGDTARYLIQNPFPGANALISIERYGVLKHWVQKLESSTAVIEFPVEEDFVPGFYLSVLVMSPRVDQPVKDGVDLGKPAFRLGYLKADVVQPYKEIQVNVVAEKELYKPRETVNVSFTAQPRHPGKKEPIELAIAVLDESVFDLLADGKNAFDPYKGFYNLDGLDVKNYSLLLRLIGHQKFEKKGANAGGDGGMDLQMRSRFKFVAYWNPSVVTDEHGNADISFTLPDNLTGWRVLAMAVTPTDRMGLGEGNIKTNLPTEVRPVMPNQVTEGDRFDAGFSVMNRTDKPRDLKVHVQAKGDIDSENLPDQTTKTVHLKPFERSTVFLPVQTLPVKAVRSHKKGSVQFTATAQDGTDGDGMKHTVPVHKRRSLETAATYGSTTESHTEESFLFPKNIHTDVGAIAVTLAPSVIGNTEGAFRYMRDYPYYCWEQILSKGAMAALSIQLNNYLSDEFEWPGREKLPDSMLRQTASFQAPNGGMVYFIPRNSFVSPYLSAYTALAFNWMRNAGYEIPAEVEKKLHGYLKKLLKRNVLPGFYSKGMASTVRAVALAALAPHGEVNEADLKRYQKHLPDMSLFGRAHYLLAAIHLKADEPTEQVTEDLLSHAVQSGGKLQFNETLDDGYTRILSTPLRTQCAILTALSASKGPAPGKLEVGDLPFRMVRSITQTRGNRDHWENTQENMFCMNALTLFSKKYEQTPPDLTVQAFLGKNLMGETHFKQHKDPLQRHQTPILKEHPGTKTKMVLEKKGKGRFYYSAQLEYAPLEDHVERTNAGVDIRREYSVERNGQWELLKTPAQIKRGELVRVDLFLSLPTARNFLVVDDPVPGGLEPVNRDLATASTLDADKGNFKASGGSFWFQFSDWHHFSASRWSFYHKELRHDAARFYSEYLSPGNYHLSYTAQAIAPGQFTIMPVKAEEMYDPDIFGKGLPSMLNVEKEQETE